MAKSKNSERMARIVECAEAHFGQPVDRVTAPGGEGRSSFRLHFADRDVIATLRPNFRRTHLEAHVLDTLAPYTGDIPQCLGVVGEIMFQSDVGKRRLNQEIVRHDHARQMALAADAVASIFRIQSAARQTDLDRLLPHLGANTDWMDNFVGAVDALQPYSGGLARKFDRVAVSEFLSVTGRQFVKWDCRSGNAALDEGGRMRWFDFEYCGLRHGAEDLAWLVGDEAWPIKPDEMVDVIIDAFDPAAHQTLPDYLEYLSVYLTFHCVQRFKLITKEAQKRGWLSKERVRKYDDAGVHPDFAAQICAVGAYFAAQSRMTESLSRNFSAARQVFVDLVREGNARKRA